MRKIIFFITLLTLTVWGAYVYTIGPVPQLIDSVVTFTEGIDEVLLNNKSVAMREAHNRVQELMVSADGLPLMSAPCIAEELVPDWSLDIVHASSTIEQMETAEKCINFLSGRTHHLIEYDMFGNFIQIRQGE